MNQIKIDIYTKSVLAVITLCLAILTINQLELLPKAYAGESINHPTLTAANYGLVPLNEDGSITVKFSSTDEIDVNIDKIGGGFVSMGVPIPVTI
jgi:hypothetical protein